MNGTDAATAAPRPRARAWTAYAACTWALLFAAPHVWWALNVPTGFPGGDSAHAAALGSTWFLLYDLSVVALCAAGAFVALAIAGPLGRAVSRRVLLALAWLAAAVLTARGVAGLLVDGRSDLVWWPTFLLGGLLYGTMAWSYREAPRNGWRHG